MAMKVYYEGLVPNPIAEAFWSDRLKNVAQMNVGPEFWNYLHSIVEEVNRSIQDDPMAMVENGRFITGFRAVVTNSAITVNPLF